MASPCTRARARTAISAPPPRQQTLPPAHRRTARAPHANRNIHYTAAPSRWPTAHRSGATSAQTGPLPPRRASHTARRQKHSAATPLTPAPRALQRHSRKMRHGIVNVPRGQSHRQGARGLSCAAAGARARGHPTAAEPTDVLSVNRSWRSSGVNLEEL